MDLEKITSLAQNGDIPSMHKLAEYYFDCKEYYKADFWYKKLYNNGLIGAVTLIALLNNHFAKMHMELDGLSDPETIPAIKEAYVWAKKKKQHIVAGEISVDSQEKAEAIEEAEAAAYNLAIAHVFRKEYTEIASLSDDLVTTRGKIICGLGRKLSAKSEADLYAAYEKLVVLERNTEYASKSKDSREEFIYTWALIELSNLCRCGVKNISADISRAFDILSFGNVYVKDTENKDSIQNELSHYNKKMFGGYKYI